MQAGADDRDRENTTILVNGLASGTDKATVQSWFIDVSCCPQWAKLIADWAHSRGHHVVGRHGGDG